MGFDELATGVRPGSEVVSTFAPEKNAVWLMNIKEIDRFSLSLAHLALCRRTPAPSSRTRDRGHGDRSSAIVCIDNGMPDAKALGDTLD